MLYCHDSSTTKKIDFDEVVVYDKDEMTSVSSAEKISKNNSIKVFIWKVVFSLGLKTIFL